MNIVILFWVLSFLTIMSALMVVLSKSPIKSAIFLILTFFLISSHYLLMNAQFLAVVNIIVYAGAIMVLFLFVIMMMNLNTHSERTVKYILKTLAFIASVSLLVIISFALNEVSPMSDNGVVVSFFDGEIGIIKNLGKVLFSKYVVSFEISSVLFLSAMISVVVIGKSENEKLAKP